WLGRILFMGSFPKTPQYPRFDQSLRFLAFSRQLICPDSTDRAKRCPIAIMALAGQVIGACDSCLLPFLERLLVVRQRDLLGARKILIEARAREIKPLAGKECHQSLFSTLQTSGACLCKQPLFTLTRQGLGQALFRLYLAHTRDAFNQRSRMTAIHAHAGAPSARMIRPSQDMASDLDTRSSGACCRNSFNSGSIFTALSSTASCPG